MLSYYKVCRFDYVLASSDSASSNSLQSGTSSAVNVFLYTVFKAGLITAVVGLTVPRTNKDMFLGNSLQKKSATFGLPEYSTAKRKKLGIFLQFFSFAEKDSSDAAKRLKNTSFLVHFKLSLTLVHSVRSSLRILTLSLGQVSRTLQLDFSIHRSTL